MSSQIYWVGGGKGGVGKSMVSMALLDYLVARGVSTMLIESDTSNPFSAPGEAPIITRVVSPDDPGLEPNAHDLILLSEVDHLLADRVAYLRRLVPALR